MSRKKLLDEDKKPKISITLDENLDKIMEGNLKKIGLNRSKYIENLIRKDFENRGYDITPDVEK
jgi:metal-responsive CopG/Arc/MetJ family transcriptional regulator